MSDGWASVEITRALAHGDVAALCAAVDGFVLDGRWDDLMGLRDAARTAAGRGVQTWPAAAWAEYRLALDGPVEYAAPVVDSPLERFALGPFSEVVGGRFCWDQLAAHLERTPGAAAVLSERVLRGDTVAEDPFVASLSGLLGLPARRAPFEPSWPGPRYGYDRIEDPAPVRSPVPPHPVEAEPNGMGAGDPLARDRVTDALGACVAPWRESGRVRCGAFPMPLEAEPASAAAAAAAEVARGAVRWWRVEAAEALAWLGWAGAGGGATGRRRGGAASRGLWWWLLACIGGVDDDDLCHPDIAAELAEVLGELCFGTFDVVGRDTPGTSTGWELRVSIADPLEGAVWVLDARDRSGP